MNKVIYNLVLCLLLCTSANQAEATTYYIKMADSEMKRNPESWMLDDSKEPKWNYTQGLVLKSIFEVWERTKDPKYFDYVKSFTDTMISPNGKIKSYKLNEYNIDRLNSGKILFPLYALTKDTSCKAAMDSLRKQMLTHPRTSEGGFWHKKIYEHQMWLDGIYMGSPFLAEYAAVFNEPALFDDIARQILLIAKHTRDPQTGLYYHGWDESKTQKWANPVTGQSPEFWSRSIGWYAMAMVDVLDFLPENHPQRGAVIDILQKLSAALVKFRDKETGLWYQVTDKGSAPGNYLESSASAMFIYTWAKGAQKGYLDKSYLEKAKSAYSSYIRQFIKTSADGTISVTSGCSVAGLGGNPYRDGSYEYYISEPVRDNDPKATGPFIMASLLLEDAPPIPAFPGAEGAGMYTTGGRGGNCYFVTSLEDTLLGNKKTREGALRWCLKQPGPRTILFRTAGIIHLKRQLDIPDNTTIAGQSAPGGGICIAGYPVKVNGDNVIVRYLRFRMGDLNKVEDDSFTGVRNKNVIIDHCSMSWSTDECASFYDNENFTMQWCILSESLRQSVHQKGSHGYGAIWGGKKASFHHNLLARHDSRNPRFCGSRYSNRPDLELVDFRNNVIFAWGANSGYAGEGGRYNFINNYYKSGQASTHKNRIFQPNADIGANRQPAGVWGKFYLSGNFVAGYPDVTANNRLGFQPEPASKNIDELLSETPFPAAFVSTQPAEEACQLVLKSAGASLIRDHTDKRIIHEVSNGLPPTYAPGVKNDTGFINSQSDVGGWDKYTCKSAELPVDNDRDGIPDAWMKKHFPGKKATDCNEEGYTCLEIYLNSLVLKIFK